MAGSEPARRMTRRTGFRRHWKIRRPIAQIARAAAGWVLVFALFYSPWDFGATSASAIRNLNLLLVLSFAFWLIGSAASRRRDQQPSSDGGGRFSSTLLFLFSILLLAFGWGMALNAHSLQDGDYLALLPLSSPLPSAPGSIDYALSVALMRRVTALLASVWVIADLSQDENWLLRFWWAIGLAGGSIALLGLIQKATGAPMIFWAPLDPGEPSIGTFFATYYYHGNAGAYLNLALPAVIGLAYRYLTRRSHPAARALWLTLLLIMIVAVISDTSRMGQLIAILMAVTLALVSAGRLFRRFRYLEIKTAVIALLVVGLGFWAIVRVSHLDQSLGRWLNFRETWANDARWLVDQAALAALPRTGAWGLGPGTFAVAFPWFNHLDRHAQGDWLFLHNDYLQTLMEWGWVGGIFWTAYFLAPLIIALRGLTDRSEFAAWSGRRRLFLLVSVVALGGVALHALVDFPLQISSIQLYVATYLGICWGSSKWSLARSVN